MKPTQIVIDAITKAFPKEANEMLAELKYDSIMRCWYFVRGKVFTGIEDDGYIHQ